MGILIGLKVWCGVRKLQPFRDRGLLVFSPVQYRTKENVMSKSKGFNGYPNWTQWNVSVWINNDEVLYGIAQTCIKCEFTKQEAAIRMQEELKSLGVGHTPDGAKYSVTAIRKAMVGMKDLDRHLPTRGDFD